MSVDTNVAGVVVGAPSPTNDVIDRIVPSRTTSPPRPRLFEEEEDGNIQKMATYKCNNQLGCPNPTAP